MKINIKLSARWLTLAVALLLFVPLTAMASSAQSGLAVAMYKVEGAENVSWTDLPISTTSSNNSHDIRITEPGMSVVTLYAEDRAGNQNYQIKSFEITSGTEDAPVKTIEYRLRGATTKDWSEYGSPFTITNEGITYMDVKIIDEAGNVTEFTQDVRLDKTAPVNVEAVISLD